MTTSEEEIEEQSLPTIPTSLQYLITEYGNYVGLEGFTFDEENQIILVVGGKEVLIEYANEETGLIFQSLVTTLEAVPSQDMLTTMQSLNAASLRNAHGIVVFNPENQTVIWMDRLSLAGLTVEALDQAIDATERKIQVWGEMISKLIEDDEKSSAQSEPAEESFPTNAIAV